MLTSYYSDLVERWFLFDIYFTIEPTDTLTELDFIIYLFRSQ